MKTTRRKFIQLTGLGTVGLGLISHADVFGKTTQSLPRKSPESQGVDSAGITAFLKATKASGLVEKFYEFGHWFFGK